MQKTIREIENNIKYSKQTRLGNGILFPNNFGQYSGWLFPCITKTMKPSTRNKNAVSKQKIHASEKERKIEPSYLNLTLTR